MPPFKPFANRAALEYGSSENAPQAIYCGNNTWLCNVLKRQIKMFVPSTDVTMAPHLALEGYWEPWITMYVQNLVKPGWRVVNVGAAFGYYTLLCARLGAKVIAFEPQEDLCRLMQHSVEVNGLAGACKVVNAACGAERARLTLYVDPERVGGSTLQERGQQEGILRVRDLASASGVNPQIRAKHVEVRTLDDYFDVRATGAVDKIDLFIIDTEGHEPEVLRGARQLLEFNHQAIIVIELSPAWYSDATGFLRELRQRYTIHDIDGDGKLKPISDAELLGGQKTVALLPNR